MATKTTPKYMNTTPVQQTTTTTITVPQEDIVTPAELAVDFKTTKPTVLAWYHRGLIPAVCAHGRIIRFSRSAVTRALAGVKGGAA